MARCPIIGSMSRSLPKLFKPLFVSEWVAQWIAQRPGRQQTDLADEAGITDGYLSELMSGKKKNPSAHALYALSEAMGITINDFYQKPPTAAELERFRNLSPSDAAMLSRLMEQAKRPK